MPRTKNFDQQEVLEKAINLFWEQGYNATSMQQLVDHLGINRASLYDTYGSKKQLFIKAFNIYHSRQLAHIETLLFEFSEVKVAIRQYFESITKQILNDQVAKGCFVVNTTTELLPADEDFKDLIAEYKQEFVTLLDKRLKKGISDQQLAKDIDSNSLALAIYSYQNGIKVIAKTHPTESDLQDMVDVFLEILE